MIRFLHLNDCFCTWIWSKVRIVVPRISRCCRDHEVTEQTFGLSPETARDLGCETSDGHDIGITCFWAMDCFSCCIPMELVQTLYRAWVKTTCKHTDTEANGINIPKPSTGKLILLKFWKSSKINSYLFTVNPVVLKSAWAIVTRDAQNVLPWWCTLIHTNNVCLFHIWVVLIMPKLRRKWSYAENSF